MSAPARLPFGGQSSINAPMADNVLTMIATVDASPLIAPAVEEAMRALAQLGAQLAGKEWLADGIACDIAFDDLPPDQADAACRSALAQKFGAVAIDLLAQPVAGRRKSLLVADMEATIIANEMLDELADLRGLRAQISAITARAMNGDIDFAAALKERVALLANLPASALTEVAARIRINPGAQALVTTMRARGAYAALVSGGFHVFADDIKAKLGFDLAIANTLVVANEKLSGTVQEPILAREAKLAALTALAAERGLPLAATLAVGDGANDLPMIEAAGLGIAYHAKPAVAARARWRVDHADLTALLYAQGYRGNEIIGA
jgi:phosphoserine phosphatase